LIYCRDKTENSPERVDAAVISTITTVTRPAFLLQVTESSGIELN